MRRWDELPENALQYVKRLGEILGRQVEIVSVGPDREQTIFHPDCDFAVGVGRSNPLPAGA